MDGIQEETLLKEVKNFKELKKKYNYENIDELIGHCIEEGVISSKKELIKIASLVKNKAGIKIDIKKFKDCQLS